MGSEISSDCRCGGEGGFLGMCAPEGQNNELLMPVGTDAGANPSPYSSFEPEPRPITSSETTSHWQAAPETHADEDETTGFVPPPPEPISVGPTAGNTTAVRVSLDLIIDDLDSAEQLVYGDVYSTFPDQGGLVQPSCVELRSFIVSHSSIKEADIDPELFRIMGADDGLSQDNFVALLRQHASVADEGQLIGRFMDLSGGEETVTADVTRTMLLGWARQMPDLPFSEQQWDRLLDVAMSDAGMTIPMDQWINHSKKLDRMARLGHFLQQ